MTPRDVRELPREELASLAENVRRRIISVVSENGGHLSASLGAVELAIGLLRTFDPEVDKVLWDVGHQAYAWKILTGRDEAFGTLRRHHGISGFPNPKESPYDAFIAGHAGSALGAAVGLAAARDRLGGGHVVVVVGDASLANAGSLEALNCCTSLAQKVIVVVNDNAMSISKNVGAFARTLGRLLSDVRYNRAKAVAERAGHRMRLTFLRSLYHRVEQVVKSLWLRNSLFESLGLRYIGPVDGHDLAAVTSALMVAKEDKRSVVLHVVTKKGKGFPPAEADPTAWHGVGPFNVEKALSKASAASLHDGRATPHDTDGKPRRMAWNAAFGDAMLRLAKADERVCVVVAAMKSGTGLDSFAKAFPGRFFDVGICEGLAVTFAAGLAKAGMRPVVAIYSTFLQRSIDQIQHDVCLQGLPVVFAVDRAGCVGADGATHHGLYDIALLKPLTGMRLLAPTCAEDVQEAFADAVRSDGPVAIRYPKGNAPSRAELLRDMEAGKSFAVDVPDAHRPPTVALCAVGDQVAKACAVRRLLADRGVSAKVVPVNAVKPFAGEIPEADAVATLENGVVCGGFGESINADLRFGWPDAVVGHGTVGELEGEYGFDARTVADRIADAVLRHRQDLR